MKIGLALAGGGAKGTAHIGVLRAFEQNDIHIDMLAGTSSGSIIASLYAMGYSVDEIEDIFLGFQPKQAMPDVKSFGASNVGVAELIKATRQVVKIKRNQKKNEKPNIVDLDLRGSIFFVLNLLSLRKGNFDGFVKGELLEKILKSYCDQKGVSLISDVKIPLAIPAVDINSGQIIMFISSRNSFISTKDVIYQNNAHLWECMRASAAFPMVFKPKKMDQRTLVDGGLLNNLPVEVLRSMGAEKVIAVSLNYSSKERAVENIFDIAARSIDVMSREITSTSAQEADYLLTPHILEHIKLLEFDKIKECIDTGYWWAKKYINNIRAIIQEQ